MAALSPPVCNFGWRAPDFSLPATDGNNYELKDIRGERGTLIIFMCNHCPFVLAILDRLVRDARDLQDLGIGVAGICSNDAENYPDDSFDNMVKMSRDKSLPFPYLHDQSQQVARLYDAICTPDFFGFDAEDGLQYRGRLDASRKETGPPELRRDLHEAMKQVASSGRGPENQIPSIGCSIKWKAA